MSQPEFDFKKADAARAAAMDKIRKLLQTSGRTDAEVDTANILAAAIAEKHGIDIAEMDQAEERARSVITHRVQGEWASAPPEADYSAAICGRFFEINFFSQVGYSTKIVFVGTEQHLSIAEYVFKFLLHEFRWQWNHRRGRIRNRKQFLWGCYIALAQKLGERFERPANGNAVELSWKTKRENYIAENFGKMTSSKLGPKAKRSMAVSRGYAAGQDIEIRPAVNGNGKAAPALGEKKGPLLLS